MNRRSFLKFCGIAPVVPAIATEAVKQSGPGVYSVYLKMINQDIWYHVPNLKRTNEIGKAMADILKRTEVKI